MLDQKRDEHDHSDVNQLVKSSIESELDTKITPDELKSTKHLIHSDGIINQNLSCTPDTNGNATHDYQDSKMDRPQNFDQKSQDPSEHSLLYENIAPGEITERFVETQSNTQYKSIEESQPYSSLYNDQNYQNNDLPLNERSGISYQNRDVNLLENDEGMYNWQSYDEYLFNTNHFLNSSTNNQCAFLRFFSSLTALNLQRSFCFGAIDGILTGSSISFAAAGLDLFSPYDPISHRLLVIVLIFSACVADGLCMAVGHLFSTYIMNENVAKEREEEVKNFRNKRSESKSKLVNFLMIRGMLKIDAVSIADTLESYPDIFVSALMGDLIGNHSESDIDAVNKSANAPFLEKNGVIVPVGGFAGYNHSRNLLYADDEDEYQDYELDAESRNEGIFMMLSFSIFSVVPPLVHSYVPLWIGAKQASTGSQSFSYGDSGSVNTVTVTVMTLSFIMFFLGIWKSKFFDSNWSVFGVETVLVLILCNVSAYSLGYALRGAIFASEEQELLSG